LQRARWPDTRRPLTTEPDAVEIALLFGVFAVLLVLGVPVAFALFAASLTTVLHLGLPTIVVVQQTSAGASAASLIAIPLFIFAGEMMLRGGIAERLISFAASLVGHLRGGLGQINVLASLFFGGVSGSAIADVSAVGGTMIPQMVKRGFERDFAVNVSISAALVALLVPPSHNLILFSASAGGSISIADLFAAGIFPALLMTLTLMVTTRVLAARRGYAVEAFPGLGQVLRRLVIALPGLLLVAMIFIGIRAGVFTAIESAAVAVVYAVLVTGLVYRRLTRAVFVEAFTGAARTTGLILFVIGAAASFGWLLAYLQVPAQAVETLSALSDSKIVILLLMIVLLLLFGTFMDLAPLIIICTPIFLPVAKAFGVDPVHFGIILILTAGIGLITPPVGSVLFVGCAIGRIDIGQTLRTIWPFYVAALVVLMVVSFVPALSLWLPAALR
jgi:tripartite ATP-independent transporter DctM subunit